MTTFPTLIPSTRTFTPGFYPYTPFTGMSGRANRVRNSNAMLESQLRLTFAAITEAEMLSILTHYNGQQGSFASFLLPSAVWSGGTAADFQLTGYSWIYKEPPTVEDLMCGGHNVELLLETVPPEGISLPGGSNTSGSGVTPGTVTTAPGGTGSVTYELDAGLTAVGGFSGAIGYSLAAGEVESGSTDPDFASVSLLLHFDGSNGSTTFTDSSSAARTVTANGNAQISTAQSKFGGASLLLDGTGDYLTIASPPTSLRNWWTADYTLECWARHTAFTQRTSSSASTMVGNMQPTGGNQFWSFGPRADGKVVFYYFNGATVSVVGSTTLSLDTFYHLAVCISGTTIRIFVDGVVDATATIQGTPQSSGTDPFCIGAAQSFWTNGYIDDLRVTNAARYTADFTPPTAPFPDS